MAAPKPVIKRKWDFGFEADAAQGHPVQPDPSIAGKLMRQRRSKPRFSDLARIGEPAKPHVREADDPGDCPKCGHSWARHVERHRAVFQCMARDIDASGNFDGCGCGEVPPTTKAVYLGGDRKESRGW